nr:hypothetical protein [Tanacetum cinerariifolium]
MDPSSNVEKTCLGENVIEISSDKGEGHGDSPEFQDTANNGGKKEMKAMVVHKMETEEISDRFVAPCFVNGLEAYDREINLGIEENMISNEFAVKLCLEHKVKRRNKVVKKKMIVALRGEIYFVKFIINLEEDDVEPGFVCRMGKSSRNKRKQLEKYQLIYYDIRPSMSTGTPLTQKEAEREALAIICERYFILEEERPVIETMAYSDKYNKILDGICLDKMKLDGMNKEEEEAIIKIKGEALIEKDYTGAFVIPIQLEGVTTILAKFLILDMPIDRDTSILPKQAWTMQKAILMMNRRTHDDEAGSSRPKRSTQYETVKENGCGEEINGMLRINLCETGTNEEIFNSMMLIRAFNINELIYSELFHEFYSTYEFDEVCADDELKTKNIIKYRLGGRAHSLTLLEFAHRLGLYHVEELAEELDEEGFNVYFQRGLRSDEHFNAQEYWLSIFREENLSLSRSCASTIRNLVLRVLHKMITYGLCQRTTRDLDTTTLRELIDSEGILIPEDPQPDVPRVSIPRSKRASMQDLYERMGNIEIRQGAIDRMDYRQSYQWDRYAGVFEHMAKVYNVPL